MKTRDLKKIEKNSPFIFVVKMADIVVAIDSVKREVNKNSDSESDSDVSLTNGLDEMPKLLTKISSKEVIKAKSFNLKDLDGPIITEEFKEAINARLNQMWREGGKRYPKLDYEILSQFLSLTGGFMTGSFILQALLEENYSGSDIDIYIPISGSKKEMIESYISFFPGVDTVTAEERQHDHYDYMVISPAIKDVVDLTNGVQLILIDREKLSCYEDEFTPSIVSYCQNTFDLKICTNGITSDQFFPSVDGLELLAKKVTTCVLQIPNKGEHGQLQIKKTEERITKYKTRGFSLLNLEEIQQQLKQFEDCSICKDNDDICDYILSCGHTFHINCLYDWSSFKAGDFLDINKIKCPNCRTSDIPKLSVAKPISQTVGIVILTVEDFSFPKDQIYRVCDRCLKPFEAGPRSCEADRETFPKRCSSCQEGLIIVNCPSCKLQLEHANGCTDFICCRYGYDSCRREKCDHGTTDTIKFCGHVWRLSVNQTHNGEGEDGESDVDSDIDSDIDLV